MSIFEKFRKIKPERRQTLLRWIWFDFACGLVGLYLALAVSTRSAVWPFTHLAAAVMALAVLGTTLVVMAATRVYSIQIRYISMRDVVAIGIATFISSLALLGLEFAFGVADFHDPLLAPTLYCLLVSGASTGMRVWRRSPSRPRKPRGRLEAGAPSRALLIGAGDAGEMIVREILRSTDPTHELVGLLDDDPGKNSTQIHGIPVLGPTEDLEVIVERHGVEEILIAIPSANGARMREIVGLASKTGAQVRTLPAVSDMIVGRGVLKQLRDVDFADLLRRNPMQVDVTNGAGYISGEVILITGGGGSIGGELARQIARLRPAQLILVGKGENSLFEIDQQLILEGHVPPVTIVSDVRDGPSMDAIFRKYSPTIVFHAAAHKHVPLMQSNPIEAIRNNVWGTYQTAELAVKYGAKKFILVSTDKAVNPSNVMGATKRVAELIVGEFAAKGEADFAVVRFGNVLGSRGSLIPALKMQIQRGGPVRVTHPDMMRYFMTIPEAAQLIIQAGVFGKRGDIYILDMGEPMRVLDVAMDIIRLHGFEPNVSMPIVFTGARPGEKLNEELTYDSETTVPTTHPQIMVLKQNARLESERVLESVHTLMSVCDGGDLDLARQCLMEFAWQGALPQQAVVNSIPSLAPGDLVTDSRRIEGR